MTIDTRASQIQTNKIIPSGSTGTGAKLLVYPIDAQNPATPNQGQINPDAFSDQGIGTDIFLFVSGAKNSKDSGDSHGVAVFGGDVHISGNFTVSGGLSTSIGQAEDGTYTDGLFTDFTPETPVGTAVDRFNEVLKAILGITAAPVLSSFNSLDSGNPGKLSFGTSNAIAGYTNVAGSGSLTAINVNGQFIQTTIGSDYRRGILDNGITVNGVLNSNVSASSPSYVANAFSDADQGVLYLEKNGTQILSVLLSATSGAITASTPNGSTLKVSPIQNPIYNGLPFTSFKFRTGTYDIVGADQNNGWNVIKVTHQKTSGSSVSNIYTNYIDWIVDSDNSAIAASNNSLSNLNMTGLVYLTGIKYYTGGTADYKVDISNAYKNAFSFGVNGSMSFGGSGLAISGQSIPDLGVGENENKVVSVTGSATISSTILLNAAVTASITVPHPITADQLSNGGISTISNILLYNLTPSATVLTEDFRGETYRLSGSNNFDSQAMVTNVVNYWSSSMNRATTKDLIVYNDLLVGKATLANGGNFSTITNGPASNVNYSSFTGSGSYVRYFQNNTGGSKSNFNLTMSGSTATIVTSPGSISTNNILVEAKIPGQTGWCVLTPYTSTAALATDGGGILNGAFDNSIPALNSCTFGSLTVGNNEFILIRITADHSWTGNLSSMTVAWTS